MNALRLLLACVLAAAASRGGRAEEITNPARVIIVVGAAGEPDYGSNFVHQASLWEAAALRGGARPTLLGRADGPTNDVTLLRQLLEAEPKDDPLPLWLVLLGHGTYDGKQARFNLRGPDLTADDLASWLKPFRRPLALIDAASASAPFLTRLSATNRVVVTATRSGNEQNYARFGEYLATALTDPEADLDQDGQVSLLEAFLAASRGTAEFYRLAGRLATEHALLDDNGDGLGVPADWFRGLRAVKTARQGAAVDGRLAQRFCLVPGAEELRLTPAQRARREALEAAVQAHRERKATLPEEEYYRQLEQLLLPLARFYETEVNPPSPAAGPPSSPAAPSPAR